MKLVMVSNFMNHHQLEMCEALNRLCNEFSFICLEEMPDSVKKFGYDDLSKLSYVYSCPKNDIDEQTFVDKIIDADAVIFGACPAKYVKLRTKQNKLSFIFSERLWKKGTYRRFIPFIRKKVTDKFVNKPNLYALAASCYLANDLKLVGFDANKCYTWGYFPPFEKTDVRQVLNDKPERIHICWVGRFIPLKHCEDVLHALGKVKKDGYDFIFDLVGSGECLEEYKKIAEQENLKDNVVFHGSMPQRDVRKVMKNAHIYIFSSDFNEGWGAVVNEAMNSVCAPIISHAAGSSGFLIEHGKNGFVYPFGNIDFLASKIEELIDNPQKRESFAIKTYETLANDFNGTEAAKRLVNFIDCALNDKPLPEYKSGPISKSPVLKNNWFKG